jgi:hypothetical protein
LGRQRNRDGNQLLVFHRNCSIRDRGLIECPKRRHHFRRESVHFFNPGEVLFVVHMAIGFFGLMVIGVQAELLGSSMALF